MAAERDHPTLADYVVLALNPVLIMLLVGSLAFFLLEVCYAGAHGGEMRWTLFFFVMAVVLISRISITGDISPRAGCYAPLLGLLVWLSLQTYVQYPPDGPIAPLRGLINLGLIGIIWWCAHCLTWDCTYQGKETDQGDAGLLPSAGLLPQSKLDLPAPTEESSKRKDWMERYKQYRAEQQKKRVPGKWVIWFSLAALPLFGLGQSLIPLDAQERRQYAFWLLTLYVGSGLGLLLTTRFLGLRRYLRQRKLKMPPALTGAWLSMGGTLIVVLLLLGAFLPRPHPEYPLFDFEPLGSTKPEASQHAMRGDQAGEGKGQPGGEGKDNEDAEPGDGEKGKRSNEGGGNKDKGGKDGKGEDGKDGKGDKGGKGEKGNKGEKKQGNSSSRSSSSRPSLNTMLAAAVATVLKWIVFAIIALIVLFYLLRNGLGFLAQFFDWARRLLLSLHNLFAGLFNWRHRSKEEAERAQRSALLEQPFAAFANPFHNGQAQQQSVRELLCYSFAALEAWAREHRYPRLPGETPLEFAVRLGDEVPALEDAVRRLTNLFVRIAYTPEELPETCLDRVEAFWQELEARDRRPALTPS